jgi:hypothetical protein
MCRNQEVSRPNVAQRFLDDLYQDEPSNLHSTASSAEADVLRQEFCFFAFLGCLRRSSYSFAIFFGPRLMNLYSHLISVCRSFTRRSWSTTTGSAAKSGFMTPSNTCFGAPGLHRMLMYVKVRVSPSSEMAASRKASCTLNLTALSR